MFSDEVFQKYIIMDAVFYYKETIRIGVSHHATIPDLIRRK